MLTHHIDEESSQRCKCETELKDLIKKHQAAKQVLEVFFVFGVYNMIIVCSFYQAVKIDKVKLTQQTKDLQVSILLLKGSHHTEADWKRIETQHKVCIANAHNYISQ